MSDVLTRYRAMAWVVGVLLIALTLAMVAKYGFDSPEAVAVVAPLHGALFVVYLLAALQLALARRWSLGFTALVLVSGTVPLLSFVMERRVTARERTAQPR